MKALATVGGGLVGGLPGALIGMKLASKKKPAPAPTMAAPAPRLDPAFGAIPAPAPATGA